jgi:hypothetical protein
VHVHVYVSVYVYVDVDVHARRSRETSGPPHPSRKGGVKDERVPSAGRCVFCTWRPLDAEAICGLVGL